MHLKQILKLNSYDERMAAIDGLDLDAQEKFGLRVIIDLCVLDLHFSKRKKHGNRVQDIGELSSCDFFIKLMKNIRDYSKDNEPLFLALSRKAIFTVSDIKKVTSYINELRDSYWGRENDDDKQFFFQLHAIAIDVLLGCESKIDYIRTNYNDNPDFLRALSDLESKGLSKALELESKSNTSLELESKPNTSGENLGLKNQLIHLCDFVDKPNEIKSLLASVLSVASDGVKSPPSFDAMMVLILLNIPSKGVYDDYESFAFKIKFLRQYGGDDRLLVINLALNVLMNIPSYEIRMKYISQYFDDDGDDDLKLEFEAAATYALGYREKKKIVIARCNEPTFLLCLGRYDHVWMGQASDHILQAVEYQQAALKINPEALCWVIYQVSCTKTMIVMALKNNNIELNHDTVLDVITWIEKNGGFNDNLDVLELCMHHAPSFFIRPKGDLDRHGFGRDNNYYLPLTCNPDIRSHAGIAYAAFMAFPSFRNPVIFNSVSNKLRNNFEFVKRILKVAPFLIAYVGENLLCDNELFDFAVTNIAKLDNPKKKFSKKWLELYKLRSRARLLPIQLQLLLAHQSLTLGATPICLDIFRQIKSYLPSPNEGEYGYVDEQEELRNLPSVYSFTAR